MQLTLVQLEELKMTPRAIKRHKKGLCATPRCRNKYRPRAWFCQTCAERSWRFNDPVGAYLRRKKANCKMRGILWDIPDEWFREWAVSSGFADHMKHEDFSKQWSIDRIRSDEHYHINNIQCMPIGINSKKEAYRRKYGSDAASTAFTGVAVDQDTGEIMNVVRMQLDESVVPVAQADNEVPF